MTQIENISCQKRVDRLLTALKGGQHSDDDDEIVTIITFMNETKSRSEILDSLYANAPWEYFSPACFTELTNFLEVLLTRSNNADDYRALVRIFAISNLYSMNVRGTQFYARAVLSGHEAWKNSSFWLYCTDEIVAKDVERWAAMSWISFDLLSIDEFQVTAILAINTVQAVISSMRAVDVRDDILEEYVRATLKSYGLTHAEINLLRAPTDNFKVWLLDRALQTVNETLDLDAPQLDQKPNPRPASANLGYSALLEIFFLVCERTVRFPTKYPVAKNCLCGRVLGGWRPIGLLDRAFEYRSRFTTLLCESCFRRVFIPPGTPSSSVFETHLCVVPTVQPEPPTSFSAVFYGHGTEEQRRAERVIDLSTFSLPGKEASRERNGRRNRVRELLADDTIQYPIELPFPRFPPAVSSPQDIHPEKGHVVDTQVQAQQVRHKGLPEHREVSGDRNTGHGHGRGQGDGNHGLKAEVAVGMVGQGKGQEVSRQGPVTNGQGQQLGQGRGQRHETNGHGHGRESQEQAGRERSSHKTHSRSSSYSGSNGPSHSRANSDDLTGAMAADTMLTLERDINTMLTGDHQTAMGERSVMVYGADGADGERDGCVPRARVSLSPEEERQQLARFLDLMSKGVDVIKLSHNALAKQQVRTIFLDEKRELLCWLPPGRTPLVPNGKHHVRLSAIRQIRVGAGRYKRCVNLVFNGRTVVLKAEDPDLFKLLVDGLISLTGSARVGT